MHPGTICDILVNGFGKRVGLLEDHPHFFPEDNHVGSGCVDILIIERDLTGNFYVIDKVIQPVEASEQG